MVFVSASFKLFWVLVRVVKVLVGSVVRNFSVRFRGLLVGIEVRIGVLVIREKVVFWL